MKKTILLIALVTVTGSIFAKHSVSVSDKEKSAILPGEKAGPKKTTTSGTISFNATTAKDAKPKAENKTVIASIDIVKGTVAFEVIVKNFSVYHTDTYLDINLVTYADNPILFYWTNF